MPIVLTEEENHLFDKFSQNQQLLIKATKFLSFAFDEEAILLSFSFDFTLPERVKPLHERKKTSKPPT